MTDETPIRDTVYVLIADGTAYNHNNQNCL